MEKVLKFMHMTKEGAIEPFPNTDRQIQVSDFTYSAQRMGGAPSISAKVMYPVCLDNVWTESVFAEFNGEKYFIKNTPTSSKNNSDHRYTHNVELVSERIILDNVYFYDVVNPSFEDFKPVTNSATVFFFGGVRDFVKRLNASLIYAKLGKTKENPNGYEVVVDADVTDEEKQITFENQFFSNVLQEIYNTFKVPYYFDGKTIHVGKYAKNTELEKVQFEYGAANNLVSVTKTNSNNKIVNRIAGEGSPDNIPYYYPNDTPLGEVFLRTTSTALSFDYNAEIASQKLGLDKKLVYSFDNVSTNNLLKNHTNERTEKEFEFPLPPFKRPVTDVEVRDDGELPRCTKFTVSINALSEPEEVSKYREELFIDVYNVTKKKQLLLYEWDKKSPLPSLKDKSFEVDENDKIVVRYYCSYKNIYGKYEKDIPTLFSVGATTERKTWKLNDMSVDINSYGITITSGEPKNGDEIYIQQGKYIQPCKNLMPPIYRETEGAERFYNAENGKYQKDLSEQGEIIFFKFDNTYSGNNPKEHLEKFDDIKPTIKGMKNALLQRIDQFKEVAFDDDDDNETEEKDGQLVFKHPYFYVRLHRFDGSNGFNLFNCSIDESEMMINMTSGHCGACAFKIMVSDEKQENLLQVNPDGTLMKKNGRAVFGSPQKEQNDTFNNEVWIALEKDTTTYGEQVMPDSKAYIPSTEDTFVITHIQLPKGYILAAEERLKRAALEYMEANNSEIFNFSVKISRIYLETHPTVLNNLTENSRITIKYNGTSYELYVNSYSYKMSETEILPEISVELKDSITVVKNAIQNAIGAVQQNVMLQIAAMNIVGTVKPYFVSKREDDNVEGALTFGKKQRFNGGASFGKDSHIDENGNAELESLIVKRSLRTMELVFNRISAIEGDLILTDIDTIESVSKIGSSTYRLFLQRKWDGYFTAMVNGSVIKGVKNTLSTGSGVFETCWMRVYDVNTTDNSIDVTLYKDEETPNSKNYPPSEMMKIASMGNQSVIERQKSIYISNNEARMVFLDHVDKPILDDKNYQLVLGRLPEMEITNRLGLQNTVGLFSQTVLCEKLYRIDWNGDLTTQPVERGPWTPNPSSPYRYIQRGNNVIEQHRVTYRGSTYACMADKTTEEPSWETTDWALIEGDDRYELSFISSNGTQFSIPDIDTEISVVITHANLDITQSILSRADTVIEWSRKLETPWVPTYVNGNKGKIHLSPKDMGEGWGTQYYEVGFSCKITFSKGNETIQLSSDF